MVENAAPVLNPVEIVETADTVLRISDELTRIDRAVELLALVYRNVAFQGEFDRGSASMRMMESRAYTALNARRDGLRRALYELG